MNYILHVCTLPQKRTQLLKLYYDTVYGMSKIILNNYINEGEATRLAELSLIFSPYKLLVSPTGIADIRLQIMNFLLFFSIHFVIILFFLLICYRLFLSWTIDTIHIHEQLGSHVDNLNSAQKSILLVLISRCGEDVKRWQVCREHACHTGGNCHVSIATFDITSLTFIFV